MDTVPTNGKGMRESWNTAYAEITKIKDELEKMYAKDPSLRTEANSKKDMFAVILKMQGELGAWKFLRDVIRYSHEQRPPAEWPMTKRYTFEEAARAGLKGGARRRKTTKRRKTMKRRNTHSRR